MTVTKQPQQNDTEPESNKSNLAKLLESIVRKAATETQFDAFYEKAAEQLKAADSGCMPFITRTIQRSGYREKEILLRVIKYFKGVDHLQFLQDLLSREVITPRMGRIILEIFNKSDMILEAGTASRLLDLDVLSQKIIHGLLSGSLDGAAVDQFAGRHEREREGIMLELLEEAGTKSGLLIARLFDKHLSVAQQCLKLIAAEPSESAYRMLNDMYGMTGNKEILKTAKKMAHSLKNRGIHVDGPDAAKPQVSVFRAAELPEPRAFTTMIDAEGFRLLFMFKPISPHEIKIFNCMLSQETGIADIEAITALRRDTKQLVKNLLSDKKIEFLEIPPSHGVYLMLEAAAVAERNCALVSPVVTQWKTLFADLLPGPALPAAYSIFSTDGSGLPPVTHEHIVSLLDSTEVPYWFIASDYARDHFDVSRTTGTDAPDHDPAAVIRDFFTAHRLGRFSRRLEELAFMLHLKGNIKQAQTAAGLARELAAAGFTAADNDFCRELICRGLDYFKARLQSKTVPHNR